MTGLNQRGTIRSITQIQNMVRRMLVLFLFAATISACKKTTRAPETPVDPVPETAYFPPLTGTEWQSITPGSLGWNETLLNDLYTYLESKNTVSFIILKNGKIVAEKYFGTTNRETLRYWASAGKTVTALLVGIAQQEGLLSINDRSSQYLGAGWTSAPSVKENLITIRHQLTMTTGLDETAADTDCTDPACLQYKSDAGTRWFYHNAPYTMLDKVIEAASGKSFNAYFQEKIRDRIGMNGLWNKIGYNNVYFSNARSMARYGLLLLNKGKWDQTAILNDPAYLDAMLNSSQNLNASYGYLTWLNGKVTHMLPTTSFVFPGMLFPNAPADLYAALGKNDQKLYVVPSQKLVVVRMGESAGNVQLAASSFDNELWGKLKPIIGY